MSKIEWTDATWNPTTGCTRVSAGCDNCYAAVMTNRLGAMAEADRAKGRDPGRKAQYEGLTVLNPRGDRHFNGVVRCNEDALSIPMGWQKPRRVFVDSMSDLFHPEVPFEFIDRVFAVMALCPQHTFQILTKRPERMAEYLGDGSDIPLAAAGVSGYKCEFTDIFDVWEEHGQWCADFRMGKWPLPNVMLGTSVENRDVIHRVDDVRDCPAAIRFLSCEPLIGPLGKLNLDGIHWVIAGAESGAGARFMDEDWVRSLRDQCQSSNVAFFYKQNAINGKKISTPTLDGKQWVQFPDLQKGGAA